MGKKRKRKIRAWVRVKVAQRVRVEVAREFCRREADRDGDQGAALRAAHEKMAEEVARQGALLAKLADTGPPPVEDPLPDAKVIALVDARVQRAMGDFGSPSAEEIAAAFSTKDLRDALRGFDFAESLEPALEAVVENMDLTDQITSAVETAICNGAIDVSDLSQAMEMCAASIAEAFWEQEGFLDKMAAAMARIMAKGAQP